MKRRLRLFPAVVIAVLVSLVGTAAGAGADDVAGGASGVFTGTSGASPSFTADPTATQRTYDVQGDLLMLPSPLGVPVAAQCHLTGSSILGVPDTIAGGVAGLNGTCSASGPSIYVSISCSASGSAGASVWIIRVGAFFVVRGHCRVDIVVDIPPRVEVHCEAGVYGWGVATAEPIVVSATLAANVWLTCSAYVDV